MGMPRSTVRASRCRFYTIEAKRSFGRQAQVDNRLGQKRYSFEHLERPGTGFASRVLRSISPCPRDATLSRAELLLLL
jgi:hypothetical protein